MRSKLKNTQSRRPAEVLKQFIALPAYLKTQQTFRFRLIFITFNGIKPSVCVYVAKTDKLLFTAIIMQWTAFLYLLSENVFFFGQAENVFYKRGHVV